MIDAHRRRIDKRNREKVFITDNAVDFPVGSAVAVLSTQVDALAVQIFERDADLVTTLGDKAQAMEIKGDARDELLDFFRLIVLGAKAVGDEAVPGITAKYKMPNPRTEQNLIASADATFDDAAAHESNFIEADLPADFRDQLKNVRNAFQAARDSADSAAEGHGEAVGALDALMREMMNLMRRRGALVKLKYRNNPGKLAAWAIASHLESPAKKPKPA